jgi:hypothetical protein
MYLDNILTKKPPKTKKLCLNRVGDVAQWHMSMCETLGLIPSTGKKEKSLHKKAS